MSDQEISIVLESRPEIGKAVKKVRQDGQVPAVIHDHGKESVHVKGVYLELFKMYQQAGKHHPVNLTVGGKKYLALIKEATFEPRKNQLQHVVFNAIDVNQKVTAEIPVVFEGDSDAEKAGLLLLRQIEHVEVESIPSKLPNELSVDISSLKEIGDNLHVSDIVIPEGVTLITEPEHAVVTVEESRAQAAADADAAEAAEAAKVAEATATEAGEDKPEEKE